MATVVVREFDGTTAADQTQTGVASVVGVTWQPTPTVDEQLVDLNDRYHLGYLSGADLRMARRVMVQRRMLTNRGL